MKKINHIPKTPGFKIPEGYFESSASVLRDRIALERALGDKDISAGFAIPDSYFGSNLDVLKDRIALESNLAATDQRVFDVPDGYFENLGERLSIDTLSRKRTQETKTTGKLIVLKKYVYPAIAIAASFALLVAVVVTQKPALSTENLEMASITEYIDQHDASFYESEIEALLSEEDLQDLESDVALEETLLIDYLDDRTDSYDLYIQ